MRLSSSPGPGWPPHPPSPWGPEPTVPEWGPRGRSVALKQGGWGGARTPHGEWREPLHGGEQSWADPCWKGHLGVWFRPSLVPVSRECGRNVAFLHSDTPQLGEIIAVLQSLRSSAFRMKRTLHRVSVIVLHFLFQIWKIQHMKTWLHSGRIKL